MQTIKIIIHSLISLFITSATIIFFINNAGSDLTFSELISLILIRWYYLFFACILLILSVYLRAHRWKYLFNSNTKLNVYSLFKSQFIGYFINCVSPLRIGDIIRSYVVAKNTKQKTSYMVGTIVMERFLDTITILFFGVIVLFHYGADYLEINFQFISIPFLLCLLCIPVLGYLLYKLILNISFPHSINNIFKNIWQGFSDIQFSHKRYIIIYSLLIWSIYCVNVYLIQSIFSEFELSLFDCLLILVTSSFMLMIPVGFGGLGVFHIGVQGVLNKLGIQEYNNFIILLHLYSLIMYTLYGAYFFFTEKNLKVKKLYELSFNNAGEKI